MTVKDGRSFKFWRELKRRNVPRVLAIYAGTAFVILEAADIIFPRWGLPDWTVDLVLYLLLVGVVITFILSWVYDISPGGIVRTTPDEVAGHEQVKITGKAKKPVLSNIIIAVLMVVIGILIYPKIFRNSDSPLSGSMQSSIAVLPLKIIGDDSELGFFASGLVESLTHMLSKVGNSKQSFSVIPPSEILEALTAGEARKKFGVSLVISGSIQRDQTSSRLILNLIDAKTQNLIRSEKLDYSKDQNLIIQDEIISVMVRMLGLELEAETRDLITMGGSTLNEANELYLVGRGIFREGIETLEDIDVAIDLFQRAIQKDSLFAMAYAGLAQAYTLKYHFTLDPSWNDESLMYSLKAVELNDQDAYALMSLAASLVEQGKYDEALAYYEKSKDIDSSRANIYSELAYLYEMQGALNKAEQYYKKAVELDPDSHLSRYYLGGFYLVQDRPEEAILEFEKALEYSPGHLTIMHAIAACYFQLEDFNKALELFGEILEKDSLQGQVLWKMAVIYYYQGDFESSISHYSLALQLIPKNSTLYAGMGRAYLWSGQESLANESFQNAISIAHADSTVSDINFATWFGLMGNLDSADYYLERSDIASAPEDLDATTSFVIGELFLILGREDVAYPYLESGLKRDYGWFEIRYSPFYAELKQEEDFQEMIARAKDCLN
ncbi:MAG TPA: tetratricopeptide repeat protein [Salinimicrobium catena]|uniref:Tetratricopeptide repeat protein n=1 Tax=Salinimicrobium catena TaxID=390640 RepID=A0A7C2RNV1_9FLAO|nr:tetratricopeptide repeat protein [Salinimicrobium catena]